MTSRVTVSASTVVFVRVRGEPHPRGFPHCPVDGAGKIAALLQWISAERVGRALPDAQYGPGEFWGYFEQTDVARILAKCAELGIEQLEYREQP